MPRTRATVLPSALLGRGAVVALAALLLGACASARAIHASSSDYGAYRRQRLASTIDERLAAATDYLTEHPDGAWADEMRAYVADAEPAFHAVLARSREGLERYLASLPRGPHATEVLGALMALNRAARSAQAGETALGSTMARLEIERQRRLAASETPWRWIDGLLDPDAWREPFSQAPATLIVPWAVPLPEPACTNDWGRSDLRHCGKTVERAYTVVVEGVAEPRELLLDVQLSFDFAGRLRGARLHGPELFLRALEASRNLPAGPKERSRARAAAAAHLDELLAGHGCDRSRSPLDAEVVCGPIGIRGFARGDGDDEVVLWLEGPDEDEGALPVHDQGGEGGGGAAPDGPPTIYDP